MRALVQRVTRAAVRVDGEVVSQIGPGLLVLLGITHGDDEAAAVAATSATPAPAAWAPALTSTACAATAASSPPRSASPVSRPKTACSPPPPPARSPTARTPRRDLARHAASSGTLDAREQQWANYVVEGAARMQSLIEGLLEFSRVRPEEAEFTLVDCDVVLRRALANLQAAVHESGAGARRMSGP